MLTAELNLNRRIGCEYELLVPRIGSGGNTEVQQTIAQILSANGIPAVSRSYSHSPVPSGYKVAVEFDSSLRPSSPYSGITWANIEVKTRILEGLSDWASFVPKMLSILRYLGGRVPGTSCGHHVHIDFPEARDRPATIRSLYNLIHKYEPVIYGLVAPSRRASGYARPMPDRSRKLHGCRTTPCFRRALSNWQRTCGLNLCHVFKSAPRVEFRYHAGTLDAEKSLHWLRLLNRLVEHATTRRCQAGRQVENTRQGFEAFRQTIGLRQNRGIYAKIASPELRETSRYLLRRWRHFNEIPARSADDQDQEM